MVAPLTSLTSTLKPFCWSHEAEATFSWLKFLFPCTPVLVDLDLSCKSVVEAHASDVGVSAVLSQRDPTDQKLYPYVFFSCRLTPAEWNYNVGNPELLAVVLILQEYIHWLEGSVQPFVVWTDHKNLAYLWSAKRLNSRQAPWALFLGCFQLTLTYRPGF